MKIGVLVKQVPDTETKIRIGPDGADIVREGIKLVMNPYDEFAVEQALRGGAVVCRVADAAAFDMAPEGFRPGDLLPNAKRVVVLGGAAPRAGDWASSLHEHQETMGTSDRINALGLKIAKYIEEQFGYYGLFVPPGINKGNRPFLSVALAAELSGCGSPSVRYFTMSVLPGSISMFTSAPVSIPWKNTGVGSTLRSE